MSKTAIQHLRSKAMSKARRLPPTMQRYDIKRDVGGNWRYLAGIGGNDRSDEAFLSLHIRSAPLRGVRSMYMGDGSERELHPAPRAVKILRMQFSGYLNSLQWLPQQPSVATSTVFSGYLNGFNVALET